MTRKPLLLAIAIAALAALGFWAYRGAASKDVPVYRFATVERGNLEAAVSATGTLSAVTTVQVGTQVSGKIVDIRADFNSSVKKGQLVARIDPTILEQAVRDAQAGLERNQAELEQAAREFTRNEGLFQRKVLTEVEFNNAKYTLAVARANVKSAQVALDRARQNLSYTQIYAPIDGIVVERNVDVGQTVVASMSTPQLFLIAQDLSQMQILASVDESDIGAIHDGQHVRFSVQAYPNQSFQGRVKQVRLQSKTTENVVNYTVVVIVANNSGRLLPGMTATLEFLTGTATDALLVPNAALRFRPTDEMRAELRKHLEERRAEKGAGEREGAVSGGSETGAAGSAWRRRAAGELATSPSEANGAPGSGQSAAPAAATATAGRRGQLPPMLWYLDEQGKPTAARVHAGLTDGQRTVVSSPRIKAGMQVIIGVNQATSQNAAASPFGAPGFAPVGVPPGGGPRRQGF